MEWEENLSDEQLSEIEQQVSVNFQTARKRVITELFYLMKVISKETGKSPYADERITYISVIRKPTEAKGNTMHTFGKQRNNTEEWYTPSDVIDRVRAVLGEIDLDPASNPVANEVVKARQIYTKDDDGLVQDWHGKVFLNPPFGSDKISQFVEKLVDEYQSGNVSEAIMLTDSLSLPNWFSKASQRVMPCL